LAVLGVVNVSVLVEAAAVGLIVMLVRAVVALVTWKLFTVMLLLKPVNWVPVTGSGSHSVFAPVSIPRQSRGPYLCEPLEAAERGR
jgi:hypothetical protein